MGAGESPIIVDWGIALLSRDENARLLRKQRTPLIQPDSYLPRPLPLELSEGASEGSGLDNLLSAPTGPPLLPGEIDPQREDGSKKVTGDHLRILAGSRG